MMIRHQWYSFLCYSVALWHECGENPAIFCYLMSWDAFTELRTQVLVLIPETARHESACWNPSFTSSAPCIVQKVSEN
jgi:hypothetical protein